MNERGLDVHHTTVFRWVQEYSPEIDKRFRSHLRPTNDSWRVDETYILVKGKQKYLYRAVDSQGNTLDFLLTAKRDALGVKRFFRKMLKAIHTQTPQVITVDKNPAYPQAIKELKAAKKLPEIVKLRQIKYLVSEVSGIGWCNCVISRERAADSIYNRTDNITLKTFTSTLPVCMNIVHEVKLRTQPKLQPTVSA